LALSLSEGLGRTLCERSISINFRKHQDHYYLILVTNFGGISRILVSALEI
jgi:hypothetical protein